MLLLFYTATTITTTTAAELLLIIVYCCILPLHINTTIDYDIYPILYMTSAVPNLSRNIRAV